MKVIIVDDNELNREMLSDIVSEMGVNCILSEGGEDCIKQLSKESADLILMDYMMPGMNGAEASIKIHEMENYSNLPIIAMTAEESAEVIKLLLESGISAVLHKPIEALSLYNMLSEYTEENLIKPETSGAEADLSELDALLKSGEIVGLDADHFDIKTYEALGFDLKSGIRFAGSAKNYLQYAKDFAKLFKSLLGELDKDIEAQDYESFTIAIHGLKSNFRALGQMDLFKKCQACEELGKNKEYDKLLLNYDAVKADFNKLISELSEVFASTAKKKAISSHQLKEILKELRDSMLTFDLDTADAIMSDLSNCELETESSDDFEKAVEKLTLSVTGLNYQEAVNIIDELLKSLENTAFNS